MDVGIRDEPPGRLKYHIQNDLRTLRELLRRGERRGCLTEPEKNRLAQLQGWIRERRIALKAYGENTGE